MTSLPSDANEQYHVPTAVTHDALIEALEPLCNLLGVSLGATYSTPGIIINESGITFVVPASFDGTQKRPAGIQHKTHPQGIESGELTTVVHVDLVSSIREPESDGAS